MKIRRFNESKEETDELKEWFWDLENEILSGIGGKIDYHTRSKGSYNIGISIRTPLGAASEIINSSDDVKQKIEEHKIRIKVLEELITISDRMSANLKKYSIKEVGTGFSIHLDFDAEISSIEDCINYDDRVLDFNSNSFCDYIKSKYDIDVNAYITTDNYYTDDNNFNLVLDPLRNADANKWDSVIDDIKQEITSVKIPVNLGRSEETLFNPRDEDSWKKHDTYRLSGEVYEVWVDGKFLD